MKRFAGLSLVPASQFVAQCSLHAFAMILREKAVNEWLNNPHEYQGFLTSSTVEEEAPKFMQSNFYHGELANTMVLAVSNALEIPIVVFSSALHHPLLFITPLSLKVTWPLFIAFSQYGPGHYSGVCAIEDKTMPHQIDHKETSPDFKCCCGCKDKQSTAQHCIPLESKYTTIVRCPCLRSGRKCTDACKCKKCNNPVGPRLHSVINQTKKAGQKHLWQKRINKGATFAIEMNEILSEGPRTSLEYLVIAEIIKFCIQNGLGCEVGVVSAFYSAVVEFAKTLNIPLPLGHKTIEQVDTTVREYHHNLNVFKTPFFTQLKVNVHM